jgi:exodeoxyribonuclease-3
VDVKTPEGYVLTVVSVYVHSGNVTDPDKMMQKYRFLDHMVERMHQLRQEAASGGKQAILCGDFNIAHTPLDIKNAKGNVKNSGFLPQERAYIDTWLNDEEFVDVQRDLTGPIQGPYTWWSQRGRAFDNNVGWRIDYQFATPEVAQTAQSFCIDRADSYETRWSDHAALSISYGV